MRPVCLTCKVEYTCWKNGVLAKVGHNTLRSGDQWKCPVCGHEIIAGWGKDSFRASDEEMNSPLVLVDLMDPRSVVLLKKLEG